MFIRLLLLFTFIPVLELIILIKVGAWIGVAPTIALILLTGLAGAYLARTQGLELAFRIQRELNQGRLPTEELLDGAMILVGGILLLTPGFCTDLSGFILLVPVTRQICKKSVRLWMKRYIDQGRMTIHRY
ncbi:FxsA family protein [Trichloromonas sp.]|uniref:FxsA family protein n=1 Tax=Trichloromonas sp. TaxID=3069249 RepID=UPI002A396A0C|nr:FxsA family protein [Trichloromonas sp.]